MKAHWDDVFYSRFKKGMLQVSMPCSSLLRCVSSPSFAVVRGLSSGVLRLGAIELQPAGTAAFQKAFALGYKILARYLLLQPSPLSTSKLSSVDDVLCRKDASLQRQATF